MKGVGGYEAIAFVTKKEVGTRLHSDRLITGDPTLNRTKTQERGPFLYLNNQ
ncbi:hypothetical protein [Oscillatoria acuminata]|uniref:hypothetical protein n=1 Tax=Oscillatoria acuminata TaxID=118323 RepID=UPI0003065E36|nr:hypothetical protein [Oscillatoria acuminata]